MPRYSPRYYGSPRREYSSRGRSPVRGGYSPPPRRGYSPPRRGYGGQGRRKEQSNGSLLVRNIPLDCRPDELRVPFQRFGPVRDVYIPKDYYTGEPRGFAFVQFVNADDASEAQYYMNRQIFAGREITVVVAADTRKRPEEMRRKTRTGGGGRYGGRRSPYRRSYSRSPSPRHHSGSRGANRSRSYSPSPRRPDEHDSPRRRHVDRSRSPRDRLVDRSRSPRGRLMDRSRSPRDRHVERSRSPRDPANGYEKKPKYDPEEPRDHRDPSPRRLSRSPSGSRSRSADASPERIR